MPDRPDDITPNLNILKHAVNKITDQIGLVSICLLLISAACTRLDTATIPYGLLAFLFSILAIGLMAYLSAKKMNTQVYLRALELGVETEKLISQRTHRKGR